MTVAEFGGKSEEQIEPDNKHALLQWASVVGTESLTLTQEGAVSEKSTRNEVDYAASPEWRGIAPICVR